MSIIDINSLLVYVIFVSALASISSGFIMVVQSFIKFRAQINQSMNLDLEIVRVAKTEKTENEQGRETHETWKEEIGAMEQLLTAFSSLKDRRGFLKNLSMVNPALV